MVPEIETENMEAIVGSFHNNHDHRNENCNN